MPAGLGIVSEMDKGVPYTCHSLQRIENMVWNDALMVFCMSFLFFDGYICGLQW